MTKLYNRCELKSKRKTLRNNSTKAEIILWRYLKHSQLNGRKFRRQHSIGPYIVDFYCPEKRVVIELDGPVHEKDEQKIYDKKRQKYIEAVDIRIVRFQNEEVINNVEKVIARILVVIS